MCVPLCVCGGGQKSHQPYFLRQDPSVEELANSSRLATQQGPRMDDGSAYLLSVGIASSCHHGYLSYMGPGPSNSGPRACKTSPFLTDPPSIPISASLSSHSVVCQESSLLEMSLSGPLCSMEVGYLRSKDTSLSDLLCLCG